MGIFTKGYDKVSGKKDAGIAAILSFFLPGLGQIYNEQILDGITTFIVFLFLIALTIFTGFFLAPLAIGWWAISIIYAYHVAIQINKSIEKRMWEKTNSPTQTRKRRKLNELIEDLLREWLEK